jgi:hypothetical protein
MTMLLAQVVERVAEQANPWPGVVMFCALMAFGLYIVFRD